MEIHQIHDEEPAYEPGPPWKKLAIVILVALLSAVAGGVAQAITERIVGV
ncbi:hypothetical protein ACWGHU_25280 [Streptomyces xanthophaeus]